MALLASPGNIGPAIAQEASLAGVWRLSGPGFTSDLVIQPSGRFSKLDQSQAGKNLISGRVSTSQNPPTLRLNIEDWEPKQWCGPLGCVPVQMIAAETYQYEFTNQSILVLSDANGRYAYHRLGQ